MILQALVQHYERLVEQEIVAKPGWCHAKVSYAIELMADGTIKTILPLGEQDMRGKKSVWVPSIVCVPEMVTRSSGVAANFLCDNAKYILGIDQNGTNKRVMECFEAAKERHLSILKNVKGELAKAVSLYFEQWNPKLAQECTAVRENWDGLNEGGNIIFRMGIHDAQADEQIQFAWEKEQEKKETGQTGICLVTGKSAEIARIHRGIKGVPGAQSSGAALVSFNAPAFESYGKEQSYNAPVGKYAEFAYTTALNYLLSQREYTFSLGDSIVVFWAESGKKQYQDSFLDFIAPSIDNQEQIKIVFENLREQRFVDLKDIKLDMTQKFYILCLAPNAARLSVRFFYESSFGDILKNLSKHYQRMEIVKPAWETKKYLGVWSMLQETVNQKAKDKKPVSNMAAMALLAILSDDCYPSSLYSDTIIRIRAEQGKVTHGRAAIIKAFLIKNYHWKGGEVCMGLNEECNEAAYILGRVFSVLESIQKDANPGINSTVRDRYFNSACATPASVFPILLKLKNSHIKKIERESTGSKIYYEKILTNLFDRLDEFPKYLTLEEQGKFDLGYYHQTQKRYEKREDK